MKDDKYDLILPIGERCHTKQALAELFPQMPLNLFDSLGGVSLDKIYDILKNDFDNCLSKSDFYCVNNGDGIHYFFMETKQNIRCSHIFKCDVSPEESLDKYYPVLLRLKKSTKERLHNADNILMCHATCEYNYPLERYFEFTKSCRLLFSKKKIDFLFIQYSDTSSIVNNYASDGIYIYTIPNHPSKHDKPNDFDIWSNINVLKLCIAKHFYLTSKESKTKVRYFFGLPIWKTKIKGNVQRGYLFGFIPLSKYIKK